MEAKRRVVLVRHEESLANASLNSTGADNHFYNVSGSDISVGLTELGLQRSDEIGLRLSQTFTARTPLAVAISSDYRRTTTTRDRIVAALPYAVVTKSDSRLNKRSYGLFWNLTYKGVQDLHPAEYARYLREGPLLYRPPEGENYYDLFARCDSFAQDILDTTSGDTLVVTHLAVILALRRKLDGLDDNEVARMYEEMSIPNGHCVSYCLHKNKWSRCDP